MLAKQILEILQVRIVSAGFGERTLLFPCRIKLLNCIPCSKECFPVLFRLSRRDGSRSISVYAQLRESWSSIQLIQHPGDLVFVCGLRSAAVRHDERRRYLGSEPRPENRDD